MLINWFTVFAQIFNFLILVILLRWFLYKPILRVMHKRQGLIQERWQESERLQAEAQQLLTNYQDQQQHFQDQRSALLAQARADADQERHHQLAQIRQEITEQRTAWQAELHQEQTAFFRTLQQKIIHQTTAITRQALIDLANADLERQIVQVFCDRLHHLGPAQCQTLASGQTDQPIVRTSFELPSDLRHQLRDELHTQFAITQPIDFVTSSHLICGIELKIAGQEIVWSLDTYLHNLEQRLSDALTQ